MGHSPSEWERDSSWRNRSRKRVPVPAASDSTARVAVEELKAGLFEPTDGMLTMAPKGFAVSASVATNVTHRNPPMGNSLSERKRDSSWRNRSRKRVSFPAASDSSARVAVEEAESRVVRAYRRVVDNGSEKELPYPLLWPRT
jgi:hypothetical protein